MKKSISRLNHIWTFLYLHKVLIYFLSAAHPDFRFINMKCREQIQSQNGPTNDPNIFN